MDLPTLESINLMAVLPTLIIVGWALILLVIDLFISKDSKYLTAYLAILGIVAAAVFLGVQAAGFDPASLGGFV